MIPVPDDAAGNVSALYRSATESVHRDIYLLHSSDRGRTFAGRLMGKWDINACPMSSMDIASNGQPLARGKTEARSIGRVSAAVPAPPGCRLGASPPRWRCPAAISQSSAEAP